jgi:hypothetical protein
MSRSTWMSQAMRRILLILIGLCAAAPALAQSFSETLDEALSHWRAAVWYSSTGNAGVASLEAAEFATQWRALAEKTRGAPPPPFMGDKQWDELASQVSTQAEAASAALARDDLAAGRQSLKEIGASFAALRARNGIVGFPDHVARYGEIVAALHDLAERRGKLDEARRVLIRATAMQGSIAVVQLGASAPKRHYDDPEFQRLLTQNRDGLNALMAALVRAEPPPDAYEVAGLISVVHANYNIFFLRYG